MLHSAFGDACQMYEVNVAWKAVMATCKIEAIETAESTRLVREARE